jgi:hypothetical protein
MQPYGWEIGDKVFFGLEKIVKKIREDQRNMIIKNKCNEKLFLDMQLYFK